MPAPKTPRGNWSPPIWAGCDTISWFRLLARNGFAVDRARWRMAAVTTAASVGQTALRLAQAATVGRPAARTSVRHPPVFVVGHWRSGTTHLHELLTRDPRHAYPTTFDCFAPHGSLLTRGSLPGLLRWAQPTRRPMDNMVAGWGRPQEDEFALCLLGQPSPYERMAFPNRPAAGRPALDLRGLSPAGVRAWGATLDRLVRQWTYANGGRRLVLKSPAHACRIPTLLGLFPDARFVHVVRDPYDVYPSALHLWRVLTATQGLQRADWAGLADHVFETFVTLHARLAEARPLVPPGRFHELRYEDLVRDPVGRLEAVYRGLDLGEFALARPHVEAYLAATAGYETNRYVLTPAETREVTRRWGPVIERYGYPVRPG